MSEDLAVFVAARLDEDEAAAKAVRGFYGGYDSGSAIFAKRFGQARVLSEIAAKRAILGRHKPHETAFKGPACDWCSDDVDDRPQLWKEPWPCPDARSLAAVWSDHPDYRPEWAPTP
jgi:hypothetical protein